MKGGTIIQNAADQPVIGRQDQENTAYVDPITLAGKAQQISTNQNFAMKGTVDPNDEFTGQTEIYNRSGLCPGYCCCPSVYEML